MPLNTGDRIFPSGGSPGGGGSTPGKPQGGPFQPSEIASTNLTAITVQEAQYSKLFKTLLMVGWVDADVTAAGNTSIEIDLPEAADNTDSITGSVVSSTSGTTYRVVGTASGARLIFTAVATGATVISYNITYKTAA